MYFKHMRVFRNDSHTCFFLYVNLAVKIQTPVILKISSNPLQFVISLKDGCECFSQERKYDLNFLP